jgi:predicted phosphodiesterase
LERVAPVLAARGNGDTLQPFGSSRPGVPEDPRVADVFLLDVEGFRVGLTHDLADAEGRPDEVAGEIVDRRLREHVHIALCGHTHVPTIWGLDSGTCLVNPGSPTMPWGGVATIGLLDVRPGAYEVKIVNLVNGDVELSHAGPAPVACMRGPRPRPR